MKNWESKAFFVMMHLADVGNAVFGVEVGGLIVVRNAHGNGDGEIVGFGEEERLAEFFCLFILESGTGHAKDDGAKADAFNALCIGKTASDVNALMGSDNYGNADVKAAGCTILVNGLVKAAAKVG